MLEEELKNDDELFLASKSDTPQRPSVARRNRALSGIAE